MCSECFYVDGCHQPIFTAKWMKKSEEEKKEAKKSRSGCITANSHRPSTICWLGHAGSLAPIGLVNTELEHRGNSQPCTHRRSTLDIIAIFIDPALLLTSRTFAHKSSSIPYSLSFRGLLWLLSAVILASRLAEHSYLPPAGHGDQWGH